MEKTWLKKYGGIPHEINANTTGTVVDLLKETVATYGDRPAFNALHTNLSFNEVDHLSIAFAAWLQNSLGIKKGDRVALMMPNLLAFPVVSFGMIRAGAVQVNVNPLYTPRELKHQLNDSGAETIVLFSMATPILAEIIEDTPVKNVITLGLDDLCGLQQPSPPVHEALRGTSVPLPRALADGLQMEFTEPEITQDDLIFLQYTGGTTGLSKGAMLTHGNLTANIEQFTQWLGDELKPGEETIITALPLYHIMGLMVNFLTYFKAGAFNVFIPNPRDMPAFVAEWSKWRVSAFVGVNTLFVGLMMTPGFEKCDFGSLRLAMGGGAPVQKAVSDRWKAMTGLHITEGYGLSETSPVLTANLLSETDATATIGLPLPSTDISIRGDDGEEVARGEAGELCAKGPQVMQGYWNHANEDTFTEDGYFRTGDIATYEDDGYFRIVDRKKDMILVSGFNVFPNEIEDTLARMDGLVESACIGVPDDKTGEAVKVFCVRKDNSVTDADVVGFCRNELTAYKVPKQVVFVEELPKSTVGKILRRELRDA
ncbi:AMP-binding protein [Alisedimentitalea sp. MJ-SS2]|uniref:AMP-binding protein n=1 Tax=Aliisedimentitalea sp. MJ-SS2 TaxID=3049795 RepID=UPI00290BCC97|nr:AMP-binding protein [Alisedimentitalea sp. MJ-SS2]MDU8929122.1 AMP-binding protein [Alisedimentitalea sp. MJ-SS2]